jgi:hypothetical protein
MAVAIEVPACPTVNRSYSLGRAGKPLTPPAVKLNPPAAGDNLVALVAHVPQQLVPLEIENIVQRQRQLDGPQIAGQVPAGLADRAEDELADLLGQATQLDDRQLLQVRRAVNLLQILAHNSSLLR